MITQDSFDKLRIELSVKSRNGIDFITAASVIWLIITYIWTLNIRAYDKSVLTFIAGGFMLPMAFLLSKAFKTVWTLKDNPLQPLGMWLNFAQLFYFPFLVLTMIKIPDYFVLVYVIITGAHFFPYAWFYKTVWYGIFAGIIVVGALLIGLSIQAEKAFYLPGLMSVTLIVLAVLLHFDSKKKRLHFS